VDHVLLVAAAIHDMGQVQCVVRKIGLLLLDVTNIDSYELISVDF